MIELLEQYRELSLIYDGEPLNEMHELKFCQSSLKEKLEAYSHLQMAQMYKDDVHDERFCLWWAQDFLQRLGLPDSYNEEIADHHQSSD